MMVETLQQLLPGFLIPWLDQGIQLGQSFFGAYWEGLLAGVWALIKVMLLIAPLMGVIAYATYGERKVLGSLQIRVGPNVVGPWGLFQPLADGLKVFLKEIVFPAKADRIVFFLAPVMSLAPALVAWSSARCRSVSASFWAVASSALRRASSAAVRAARAARLASRKRRSPPVKATAAPASGAN